MRIGSRGRRWRIGAGLLSVLALASYAPARAQPPLFNGDPDPDTPTLHIQPPAHPLPAPPPRSGLADILNEVFTIDVLMAAGYDVAFSDDGNEPALAFNPLAPNQIVLTSFSGSNWGSGGNSSFFYSSDGGHSWVYSLSIPPPHAPSNLNCPCDQTVDWGRDGVLVGTFLWYGFGGAPQTIYSAETASPLVPAAWIYRTGPDTFSQPTNLRELHYVDQPWIAAGPLPSDGSKSGVCVAYDNFDSAFDFAEMRTAASHDALPLDFTLDAPVNVDGMEERGDTNPGHRIAVGPGGLIFDLHQEWNGSQPGGIHSITYLLSVSADGGASWFVANSDHVSGAKIVASGLSFQGNGSKVGGVNALLGGITAIAADPSTGAAWIVYGTRASASSVDRLFLVSATYSDGNLTLGTPRPISPEGVSAYLPGVAVLPNGEVGVLFQTWNGTSFGYRFVQTIDGGATALKTTDLTSFTSPFSSIPSPNQRIFGDYLQLRSSGCSFYGAYAARGTGANSVSSIDPYFMRAPAAAACALPSLTSVSPRTVCAGGPGFTAVLTGTGLASGGNGRIGGVLRPTTLVSPSEARMQVLAGHIASAGSAAIDYLGPSPAGGRSAAHELTIESPPQSPGSSLRLAKSGPFVSLGWAASSGATSYDVRRCVAASPCVPSTLSSPTAHAYADPVLGDGASYWYAVDSVNSCGAVP